MSGEDDTFDIDIYGDEAQEQQPGQGGEKEDDGLIDYDDDFGYDGTNDAQGSAHQGSGANGQSEDSQNHQAGPSQGTKRKAEENDYGDEEYRDRKPSYTPSSQAADPRATAALRLENLHWWTTEEDLRGFCATASVEEQLRDVTFGEHKINGKSRGEAYLEFGNPFKGRDSGAQGKKEFTANQSGRGGAYNSFNRGGGFRGRGDYNNNNRGGGFNNRGGFQGGMNNQGGGWNAGGMGAMGGGFNNPMMAMGNMGMMGGMGMGNYGNMGRGGMMNRGGFNNPMMGMGMGGGGRGNMMGGGRGGWGGGNMMGGRGGWGGGGQ